MTTAGPKRRPIAPKANSRLFRCRHMMAHMSNSGAGRCLRSTAKDDFLGIENWGAFAAGILPHRGGTVRKPRRASPHCALGLMAIFLGAVLCLTGCSTSKPASAVFASVIIHGKTPEQIAQVTAQVFQADGYRVVAPGPDEMCFEKEGTRGQSLAYAGVVSTYEGAQVRVRVRAEIVDLGAGSNRLQCHAFVVTDSGFFEDAVQLPPRKAGPYRKLVKQVAERLK